MLSSEIHLGSILFSLLLLNQVFILHFGSNAPNICYLSLIWKMRKPNYEMSDEK